MDVIGFLCVSLGSSTVYIADAHAHGQRLVLVVKMATVVEECTTEDQCSVVRFFFVGERLNAKDIKKCFLFTVGSVFRVKRFTARSKNSLKGVRKSR
jgi:hypothetical protein